MSKYSALLDAVQAVGPSTIRCSGIGYSGRRGHLGSSEDAVHIEQAKSWRAPGLIIYTHNEHSALNYLLRTRGNFSP